MKPGDGGLQVGDGGRFVEVEHLFGDPEPLAQRGEVKNADLHGYSVRTTSPLRPPCFSSSRISTIRAPRSTDLIMS